MKLLAQSLGVLGILFIITGTLTSLPVRKTKPVAPEPDSQCPPSSPDTFPGGFKGAVIALEFVRTRCDAAVILGNDDNQNRKDIARAQNFDTGFIIVYWLFFVVMGFLLTQRNSQWAAWTGWLVILSGTIAAVFDLIENSRIRRVIGSPLASTTDEMLFGIREATLIKWAFIFVAIALLTATFFLKETRSSAPGWVTFATGFFFAASSITGFVGLYYHRLIPLTTLILLPGLLGLIALSFIWPETFLDKI